MLLHPIKLLVSDMCLLRVVQFLLYTMLSNTFFDRTPINNACPVGDPYLLLEDRTCQPMSNDA